MKEGKLTVWRWQALAVATYKNNRVVVMPDGTAYIKLARNKRKYIWNSTQGYQLFWGLTGCLPGHQHFRYCTSRALKGPDALRCVQCWCWQHIGADIDLYKVPKAEKLMLLAFFVLGASIGMCRQVAVKWWPGQIDFYDSARNTYIQSDGTCHEKGIYKCSREAVLNLDLLFCVAAYNNILSQGQSVVRVRGCEKSLHKCLAAALDIAACGGCIVLSPMYAGVICLQPGSLPAPFTVKLTAMLHGCNYVVLHGMHVFKRGNT